MSSAQTPRRVLSVRATLLTASIACFLTVAVAGVAIAWRIVPGASALADQGAGTRDDYTVRTQLASQLDSSLTDLRTQLDRARLGPLPSDSSEPRRLRIESVVRSSSLLDPLNRAGDVSPALSIGLERADLATADMAGALLGAAGSLEVHDVAAAEILLRRADSLDGPLSERLNDVTAAALAELAHAEQLLARDARSAAFLVLGWIALGLVLGPLLLHLMQRRLFQPLRALDGALGRIEAGDFDVDLPVTLDDELGRLSDHVRRTTVALRSQRTEGERAAGRAALEASEARYRAVFEQAGVGLAEIAVDGTYIRINRAFCDIVGRPANEITGHHFVEFTHPDDHGGDAVRWSRLVAGEVGVAQAEKHYVRPDGSVATVHVTGTPIHDVDGTPRHMLVVVHDVTERARLQHELLQSMKLDAVGQLAGGVAHDFNNLLAAIIGYAELIEVDERNPIGARDDAATICRTAMRGADLARSLLTLARRNPLRAKPFPLEPMLRETVDIITRTFDRRIAVALAVETPATILGDRSLIATAMLNLAVNARDAMSDGGCLRIDARVGALDPAVRARHGLAHTGQYVHLTVTDNGSGMPPEVLEHIFDPFFTTKDPGKGTGLGLSLVYGTVRDHHGVITAESTVGVGTRFTILLPCQAEDTAGAVEARTDLRADTVTRVLVVDDEELVRDVASRLLRHLGYDVEVAEDGIAALERLSSEDHGIDVVILDGNMPRLNGAETARHLHARHPDLPLIYASGFVDPGVANDLDSLGVRERLNKPYTLNALSHALARALGRAVPL